MKIPVVFLSSFLVLTALQETAFATISNVQKKRANTDTDTTTVTLDSNITAGNSIIATVFFCDDVACSAGVGGITVAVTATGCTFTEQINNQEQSGRTFHTFIALNCSGGTAAITSVLTGESDPHYHYVMASEWTNFATSSAVDQTNKLYSDTGMTASISTTGSTSQADELVYAVINHSNVSAVGSGYTILNGSLPGDTLVDEYKVVSSTGTQTATWDTSGGNALKSIMTVKEAVGGGGTGYPSKRFKGRK